VSKALDTDLLSPWRGRRPGAGGPILRREKKSGGLDCSKPPLVVWACQKGCCTTAFFLGRRPAVDYVDYIERKIAIPQKTESAESVPGY